MNTTSILLVIDGEEPVRHCLERALSLARALQARLDILLWRDWSSYASKMRPWATEEAMQYLHALRNTILCPGAVITTQATFGGSLIDVINEHVRQQNSALVVKIRRHGLSWHGSSVDRQLMRLCAAPLLLTDGHSWQQRPRFVATVNVLEQDSAVDRNIIQTATALRRACAAHVDLVCVQPVEAVWEAMEGESPAQLLLRERARHYHLEPQSVHVLYGPVDRVLPRFLTDMRYDLVAIGSPTEPKHKFWHVAAPTMIEAIMKNSCDVLVVNADHGTLATALASAEPIEQRESTLVAISG